MTHSPDDWTEIVAADAVDQAATDLSEVLAEVAQLPPEALAGLQETDPDTVYGEGDEDPDTIYGDDEDPDVIHGDDPDDDPDAIYGDEDEDVSSDDVDDDASDAAASAVAAVEGALPDPEESEADLSFDEAMAGADLDDLPARAAGTHWTEVLGSAADHASEEERAAYAVFGELFSRSPSFRAYAEKLVAASRPMVAQSRVSLKKARDWQLDFGPVSAPAGFVTTITERPQCLFRGEKIMANDTANPAGTGTRIVSVTVGQKIQRPAGGARGSLTQFFQANALANGLLFDTAQPWCDVAVTVSFVSACTFDLTVFGRAVVDR